MQKESTLQQQQVTSHKEKVLKILICQINPFLKNAKNTIDRVQRSLKKYSSQSQIDIVMFPEMSFIGYNYASFEEALPFSNKQMQGEQFEFCTELAKRLNSYVGFGYIQKELSFKQGQQCQPTLYNSVAIIDRKGKLHHNYRKSHLYYNDKLWAAEGSGFSTIEITNLKGKAFKCTPIICMDINPKNFNSNEYQVADHMIKSDTQVLLMFTNWVDSTSDKIEQSHIKATYQYWLHRLMPLIKTETPKQRLLVFCDRVGHQQDVFAKKKIQFFGSSCAMMLNPTYMIKNLDIENEGYLMIQTKLLE